MSLDASRPDTADAADTAPRSSPKTKTAFRLDADDLTMLREIAAHHGLRTRTDAVRMLIRAGHRRVARSQSRAVGAQNGGGR